MAPANSGRRAVKRRIEKNVETESKEEVRVRKRRRGADNLKNRTCGICNRVFTKPTHKQNHMAVHDPDRQKYTCPHPNCGMQYNDIKNWRVHFMKKHTRGPEKSKVQQQKKAEKKLKMVNKMKSEERKCNRNN